MAQSVRKSRRGFSLIELVIVVVIIGIIAAIAIPKMSRGATGASEAALSADLQVLRNALEMYQSEHNGNYPDPSLINAQLIQQTDVNGIVGTPATISTPLFGPYLQAVPTLPVGTTRGNKTIGTANANGIGWIYDSSDHTITANSTGVDSANTPYANY